MRGGEEEAEDEGYRPIGLDDDVAEEGQRWVLTGWSFGTPELASRHP